MTPPLRVPDDPEFCYWDEEAREQFQNWKRWRSYGAQAVAAIKAMRQSQTIQALPEQVFSALPEPLRQHSEQIQFQLRNSGWIIVRSK